MSTSGSSPTERSLNLALLLHSKEAHGGNLLPEHWKVTLTLSQVTEAVTILNEVLHNLLISKQEFGANNLTETRVKRGNFMAGERDRERKGKGRREEVKRKKKRERYQWKLKGQLRENSQER